MYAIETRLVPQRTNADGPYPWYTPAQSNEHYKTPYSRVGVTIHHWAKNGAANHDGIVDYFWNRTNGSVNYVLSDNKITKMVEPDNVAWCSQAGNPTTISIEHQSDLGAEGYRKSGWLVHTLEKKYGRKLTLYPHKHWIATACPGTVSLDRIRQEADNWHKGGTSVLNQELVSRLFVTYLGREPKAEDAHWIGKATNDLVLTLESSQERKDYIDKLRTLIQQATGEKVSRDQVLEYINNNLN